MTFKTLLITGITFFAFSFQAHAYKIVDENNRLYVYTENPLNIVGSVSKSGNLKGFKKLVKKAKKIDEESGEGDKGR
ncbi:MAG: hypothetical protein COB42_00715 [Sulfurimonas sp.]|nr:MAG: hypothetical protein COB42_00715 [Sulfurimonas sp.]